MNTTNVKHLENLCVINADFDIWSGQTRLAASDFKLGKGGEIPPEKIAQLGSKKICDPARLKGFHRLKTETRRFLLGYGMPFMNGYAVPVSKTDEICAKLDKIDVEVKQLKHEFVTSYKQAVDEWCSENPEYEIAIRAGALPQEEVERRIGFEYQVFMVQPTDDHQSADRLNRKVDELGDDLISEVVKEAKDFYNNRLAGKVHIATSTKATLKNIRDKVDGLSFLNSSFLPLVALLDQTLTGYHKYGAGNRNIEGMFFYQIMAAVLIMSDRQRIQEYAGGTLTVDAVAQTLTRDELRALESGEEQENFSTEIEEESKSETQPDKSQAPMEENKKSVPSEDIVKEDSNSLLDDFEAFLANQSENTNESVETHDERNVEDDISEQCVDTVQSQPQSDVQYEEDFSQDPADYMTDNIDVETHFDSQLVQSPESSDQDCYF